MFSFTFGIGLVAFAYKHPKFRGVMLIGWGFLMMGLGFVLIGLRDVINNFLSIVIANSLIYISLIMTYRGLFHFLNISVPWEKYLSSASLSFLVSVLYYFTYHNYDVNARIVGFSCSYALLCLMTAYGLLSSDRHFAPLPIQLLITTFLGIGLFYAYRAVWTSNATPLINFMNAGSIHAIAVLVIQFMVLFVTFIVVWIASDSLERELKEMTKIDPLTSLKNRRALEEFCEQEVARARCSNHPFSLIICDIDHFKVFNDHHGHQMGDRVLMQVSALLKNNVRKVDLAARYGGEQFVFALPETDCEQAEKIAEKLRLLIMNHQIPCQTNECSLSITASFGVACLHPDYPNWEALFVAADKALYRAKQSGRNCVMTARTDTWVESA
jgi:diguanylate cyclase (GGDEF)-like protein